MISFIEDHRKAQRIELICKQLRIAPSTYYAHKQQQHDPRRPSARSQRDEAMISEVQRIWNENFRVYGAREVWRQLRREGLTVARRSVERRMYRLGLRGVIRDKSVRITVSDANRPCPLEHVRRHFKADRPNTLWVPDFAYVSIRYTERLADAGLEPSVGSVGDALAETINTCTRQKLFIARLPGEPV